MSRFPPLAKTGAVPAAPSARARVPATRAPHRSTKGRHGAGLAPICMLLVALGACKPAEPVARGTTAQGAPGVPHTTTDRKPGDMADHPSDTQGVAAPSPDAVLYFIYKKDGDGATTYEVDFGSWVGYWHGQQFDLDGKRYFTGFGYKTAEDGGGDEDAVEGAVPGAVAISQATFVLESKGGKTAWSPLETDGFVGSFGGNDKPVEVDDGRKAQTFATGDGRLLLVVPTRAFANGTGLSGYAVLVFDPQGRQRLRSGHWAYLGDIPAGEDNSAACDGGQVMPCISNRGTLAFADTGAGMPEIAVSRSGTEIESPGKVRQLTGSERTLYRYDSQQGVYRP